MMYRQVSNIRGTLVGNKTVDHSDVDSCKPRRETFKFWNLVPLILEIYGSFANTGLLIPEKFKSGEQFQSCDGIITRTTSQFREFQSHHFFILLYFNANKKFSCYDQLIMTPYFFQDGTSFGRCSCLDSSLSASCWAQLTAQQKTTRCHDRIRGSRKCV